MATTYDLQFLQMAACLPDVPVTPTTAQNMDIEIVPHSVLCAARGDPLQLRYSMERDRWRAEVTALRGSLEEESRRAQATNLEIYSHMSERTQQALAQQRADFQLVAGQFEREARDVAHAEVASERTRVTSEAHQHILQASQFAREEQLQLVRLQAEISAQEENVTSALHLHRNAMMEEAQAAVSQQRAILLDEARNALDVERSRHNQMHAEFSQCLTALQSVAQGEALRALATVDDLKS